MDERERNWLNLFSNITPEELVWHGIWTVFSQKTEVVKSYHGVRRFRANAEQTVIIQTNSYTYSDGSKQEKTWRIEKQTSNQADGVIHPAALSMRILSFGQGATAWLSKKLEPGKYFGNELFLSYKDWRTSVGSVYGESGNLERISMKSEHLSSFPNDPLGSEVGNIYGNWLGKKEYMSPDLKVSAAEVETWPTTSLEMVVKASAHHTETFFLPDGVVVNIPKKVNAGEEFEIVFGKLFAENEYKRLTAKYDKKGEFALLISEVFHRCRGEETA